MPNIIYFPGRKGVEPIREFLEFLTKEGRAVKIDAETFDLQPIAVIFEPGNRLTIK
jgi:hypothetical protein